MGAHRLEILEAVLCFIVCTPALERDEQVEALRLTHLAHDDAGRAHPQRLLDQASQRNLTGALEAGLAALHGGYVAQRDIQLEDLQHVTARLPWDSAEIASSLAMIGIIHLAQVRKQPPHVLHWQRPLA
jgi:hypothetical protein